MIDYQEIRAPNYHKFRLNYHFFRSIYHKSRTNYRFFRVCHHKFRDMQWWHKRWQMN